MPRRYAVSFSKRWKAKTTVAMTSSAVSSPVAKIVSASLSADGQLAAGLPQPPRPLEGQRPQRAWRAVMGASRIL